MRTMVMILVGIVLIGIGWFWWRGDVVASSPAIDSTVAVPLPVVTGPYDHVASDCREGVAWTSTHTRKWQSLAQEYAGTVDACMEVYRVTADEDPEGDYYLAVVTSAWNRTDREDFWWPWDGGDDAPSPVTLAVTAGNPAADEVYDASSPSVEDCAADIPDAPVMLDEGDPLATPGFVAGSCGGTIALAGVGADGATWTVTRPEEFDLTVTSYQIKVGEGERPRLQLEVTPAA
ncbi:hypothetical protein [Demequina silvatica]|uniref:hypothetical protein n=1 Tax=Demequina silvatica TaxID=1638988 RepID=UPI000785686F|nr:hypothetical protein [Demequina silvatica]